MDEGKKRIERLTYTVEETADALGVGVGAAYTLCHRQDFPAVKVGKQWRIPRQKLSEWLERQVIEKAEGGDIN